MKTSMRKMYYATPFTWEFWERLVDRKFTGKKWLGHNNHRPAQRYKKDKHISKTARRLVKSGILDGVDLLNFNNDE